MITAEEHGRAYLYRPASSRADHTAQLMTRALDDSTDQDRRAGPLSARIPTDEAEALKALDRRRGHRWRGPGSG